MEREVPVVRGAQIALHHGRPSFASWKRPVAIRQGLAAQRSPAPLQGLSDNPGLSIPSLDGDRRQGSPRELSRLHWGYRQVSDLRTASTSYNRSN